MMSSQEAKSSRKNELWRRAAAIGLVGSAVLGMTGCKDLGASDEQTSSPIPVAEETVHVPKYSSIEAIAGDPEKLKEQMTIPAGLSDQEFAARWVQGLNTVYELGHRDDYKDFDFGSAFIDDFGDVGGDPFCQTYVDNLTKIYNDAVYNGNPDNNQHLANTIKTTNEVAWYACRAALATQPGGEYDTGDKEKYHLYVSDYTVVEPSNLTQHEDGGRSIVIEDTLTDNREMNRASDPSSSLYISARNNVKRRTTIETRVYDGVEYVVSFSDSVVDE